MKIIPIEGNRMRLDGGAMFGNCPKVLWSKWHTPDEQNRIELATRCMLLQTDDGRNVLFETGTGVFYNEKMRDRYGIYEKEHMLIRNLEKVGFKESDIDIIILSHLHFDHAGGILSAFEDGPLRLLFPKAKIYTGAKHWERAQQPHMRERASFIPELPQLLKDSGRLKLIEGNDHPDLDLGLKFFYSDGHTIGMMISILETPDGPLAYAADLVPGKAWVHLPISMGYDRYSELLIDEKRALFKQITPRHGALFFTHDPVSAQAKLTIDEHDHYQIN